MTESVIKNSKIRALVLLVVSICLTAIHYYIATGYFGKSAIGLILMLIVVFIYVPAMIASLYVLTNGWILRAFLGPMDYGYWEK